MQDLTLSIIIFLSAASGGIFGFIYGYLSGEDHANRKHYTKRRSDASGRRERDTAWTESVFGWEAYRSVPPEADKRNVESVFGASRN